MQQLAELLGDESVVRVGGTPSSGKSTLAELLEEHLDDGQNVSVVLVDNWDHGVRPLSVLLPACGTNVYGLKNTSNLVIIVDEGQHTYVDSYLWYGVIKAASGAVKGTRWCIFSSYGSPTTGAPNPVIPRQLHHQFYPTKSAFP